MRASGEWNGVGPLGFGPRALSWGSWKALDSERLPRLLNERGMALPQGFKALVVAVVPGPPGMPPGYRCWDYRGTSRDRGDWWPASTVKVFAAMAALEEVRGQGFSPVAEIVFHDAGWDEAWTVETLVRRALTVSDNAAFDRLVEVVGGDEMNAWLRRRGFLDTVLLRGYSHRVRDPETGHGILRVSRALTIREGHRCLRLPAREGRIREGCPDLGNCTTLRDLCDALRRVMLHEVLDPADRLDLGRGEVALLRSALSRRRLRGLGVVRGLRAAFAPERVACFHKPGFAMQWFSDVVFLTRRRGPARQWLLALAGFGGREVLDRPARVLGDLLVEGVLSGE